MALASSYSGLIVIILCYYWTLILFQMTSVTPIQDTMRNKQISRNKQKRKLQLYKLVDHVP